MVLTNFCSFKRPSVYLAAVLMVLCPVTVPLLRTSQGQTVEAVQVSPATWVGYYAAKDRIELRQHADGRWRIKYTHDDPDEQADRPLPASCIVACHLPSVGNFTATFVPTSRKIDLELPLELATQTSLAPDTFPLAASLPQCVVQDRFPAQAAGERAYVFVRPMRLLPGPAVAPFHASRPWQGRAEDKRLGSFAPKVSIRDDALYLDARAMADGIAAPHDIAVLCDLPDGQAFGVLPATRWDNQVVRVPLQRLSDKKTTSHPSCIVDGSGSLQVLKVAAKPGGDVPDYLRFPLR